MADYIPPLARVDPRRFGMAIITVDGQAPQLAHRDAQRALVSRVGPQRR